MPLARGTILLSIFRRDPFLAITGTTFILVIAYSIFHTPNPASSSIQWPGFLPSHYPPAAHANNPLLNQKLSAASQSLLEVCRSYGALEQVYVDPGLTDSQTRRYAHLKKAPRSYLPSTTSSRQRILVVSTIREIHNQLPDLLNTLIVLVTFLGAERLTFSFIEGPSDDCTTQAFDRVIGPTLLSLGIPQNQLHLITGEDKIDFANHNRIAVLADLRNRALAPLWSTATGAKGSSSSQSYQAVVMMNDVFLHARDVLELLHQHVVSKASLTAGWDWWRRRPGYFYDIWVARTIDKGDLFYPITGTSWSPSTDLFFNSPATRSAYDSLLPFQVYSAWNGLVVLDPAPFLPPYNVRFRKGDASKGECTASECTLVAQDFWANGFGRVQVVPSVQLAYEIHPAKENRDDLAMQQEKLGWVDGVPPESEATISWSTTPPPRVRCHPWPEINGISANVWEKTLWVDPLSGQPV
ncbi:cryptococcal mannosyltransferase 1-domain-containing protein [Kockovaella imperatae]|uniref:Cryptococcal mannosyltransferase 1-domain-containing protein n=1 Tax=Kockovaella imperatae TaxID=4999 RepID=A0A1Y1UHZ8_9TREE|nr:cryptococcal mannosyltransferase 1-domain-containing protein [Kockovaella imperatae]ORX37681.1 cryptococcal mannosyltransferase 1-domain-containing protein [Kockovaella imperatae]